MYLSYNTNYTKGKIKMAVLINKIKDDLTQLRKQAEDKQAISLLTTLYSEAANVGINDGKRLSTDDEVIRVIKKFVKDIDICLEHATNKDSYIREKQILEKYLPAQLSTDELQTAITAYITSAGSPTKADIMKYLKSAYSGKYDGKLASSIIDSINA